MFTNDLADILEIESGLAALAEDMYDIDRTQLERFTEHVLHEYTSTTRHIYHSYIEGILLTTLALLHNADIKTDRLIENHENLGILVQEYLSKNT